MVPLQNIKSGESFTGSISGSSDHSVVGDLRLDHDRPTKRRRTSSDSVRSNDFETEVKKVKHLQTAEATISRIKPKQAAETLSAKVVKAPVTEEDASVPESILASTAADETAIFSTLSVDPWLVASLSTMAIKTPTMVQKSSIPPILAGRDCIAGSRTGSGKTVAFAVPILQTWARDPSGIYAVVLTPTRELALQLLEQFQAIGSSQGIKCVLITGGADMRAQALDLARRPHIVIATPGRLADHIETSGADTILGLKRAKYVVLDEADRLLAAGKGSMLPAVQTCLSALPPPSARQTLLFTATLTSEVSALQDLPRPASKPPIFTVNLNTSALTLPPTLKQTYQLVNTLHREKYLHILLLTPLNLPKQTIIFANRTSTANLLERLLRLLGHRVTALHSGLPQPERTANLSRFRAGAARILVSTDLASRGLDIPAVQLVINYDLPRNPDDYIHRCGRTARAGRGGLVVNLVGQRDVDVVKAIEERVGREMQAFEEEGVSIEGRVVRDAVGVVGEKKREAMLGIEEGRDVKGNRVRKKG
ncbi:ATP-dependent RNA helicase [Cryoendolithus antarcticus]|uniref:ATP-dependent RNA helicase n=1 Tax=Cryoendolithus antarcticus TaxID=1507870 RepID=A0A1V8SVI0_9PEZI|nr:ATP-dependent RNA helicase [Cryoendolithus antarcticus]